MTLIYIRWFLLTVLAMAASVVGVVLVPLVLAFDVNARLPRWASWWDNDIEPFGDLARRPEIEAATGWKKLLLRYRWLAWRNPANNFKRLIGLRQTPDVEYCLESGDLDVSDQGKPGHKYVTARRTGRPVAFEFYAVFAYSSTRCVRVRLGWKIDHNLRGEVFRVNDGTPAQIVHTFNPFDSFTGVR